MDITAWRRLFIALLLAMSFTPLVALASSLSIDPRFLPGGEAAVDELQQELERIRAGRSVPRIRPAAEGEGIRIQGLDDSDGLSMRLTDSRDPFAFSLLDGVERIAVLGPPASAGRASAMLAERAERRGIHLSALGLQPGELPSFTDVERLDAVLLLALPFHEPDSQRELFDRLTEAGVATLALTDAGQVERGALLSVPGALDAPAFHRLLALRLDDLAAGRTPEPLTYRPELGRPWLNLETASRLDWAPPFDLLSQSRLIAERATALPDTSLSLQQVVALALADNLGLAVARQSVEVDAFERDMAMSRWRPNLYLEATGRVIDDNRARSGLGQSPERQVTGGAVLEQLIFSEPAMAALAISESLDRARRAETEVESLDLALEVASSFIDLLRLQDQQDVLQNDLELARAQRDQASRGLEAGAVGRGELSRFEAELAQARERLEQTIADHEQLRLALNRRLGRDAMAPLTPRAPDTESVEWLGSDPRFAAVLEDRDSLEHWQSLLVRSALSESRELQALAEMRSAAARELESRRRAFWVPEVGLEARYTTEIARAGEGERAPWEADSPLVRGGVDLLENQGVRFPETGRDEWSVGISARLPLYAGGRRSIERDTSAARLEQVALQDADARQGLETRLRAASVELLAAWRRIALRGEASDHAEEALSLAQVAWREGSLEQVALLDARTTARQASLAKSEARWQYLKALVHLQRSLGMIPGPMNEADRNHLLSHGDSSGSFPDTTKDLSP
ncbi:TolC family protein [Halomonas sp. BC04]|uniref:TolC family protein n=1 Tax=Halomonas sp. BC04 TaxID=1403540 RepID=UPI0004B2676D|nr:TolC family protein [Halomonas sp. BC04]